MLKSSLFRVGLAALTTLAFIGCKESAPSTDSGDSNKAPSGDKTKTFVISAIPDEKITDQKVKFDKLATYLTNKLGVTTEFQFSKDYTDAVTKFENGEAHLVWFGGLTGVQARMKVAGAEAIAQGIEDPNYKSYFIGNKSCGVEPGKDFPKSIKDMPFTFGSTSSTSGRLMPTYFIMKNNGGVKPKEWFKDEPSFQLSGGHVATANAVADGTYMIGALSYKTYDSLIAKDPKIKDNTQILWTTPYYADYNFTIHPDTKKLFGDDFFTKVQDALVAAPKGSDALKAVNRDQIIKAKNADFDGIKKTAEELGFF